MAKYILGGLLTVVLVILSVRWYFGTSKQYKDELKTALDEVESAKADQFEQELIQEEDLDGLPLPVRRYIMKAGVVGKPRVRYFKVDMTGEIKLDREKPFSPIVVEQYSFIDSGKRIFNITMDFNGIPVNGLHYYNDQDAIMKGKILDLIKVLDASGEVMHQAETVTYFNDMSIMAPGAFLEEDIVWEEIDDHHVKGTLTKHGHEVSAILTFDEEDMLIDFISDDRVAIGDDGNINRVPWSTPMSGCGPVGDYYLPNKGDAIWHYEDDDFTYIRLTIDNVMVNGI